MKKAEMLQILVDWNFWAKEVFAGISRPELIEKIKQLSLMNEIVVVSGVRRSGKSTLLLQMCKSFMEKGIRKEDILVVNFEDPRLKKPDLDTLNQIYETYLTELNPKKEQYIILDEVQVVDGWEKFARYLHESKNVHVFVTGSSSKLLASEYATVLAGRHVDIEIFPLSFRELLDFRGVHVKNNLDIISKRHEIKRFFSEYMHMGGFPKITLLPNENEKKELLDIYFRDIIIKDIVMRYRIKEIGKLEDLAKYYLSNISTLQSFNRIKNLLNTSLDTVERFSGYLSSVYLVFFVKKFSFSEKEQLINPRKTYCIDMGMRNSAGFVFSEDTGSFLENIVFIELKRRKKEVFYWKSDAGEVDFVIKEGLKVSEAIQVCWNPEEERTRKRELKALHCALKEFKLDSGIVITEDTETAEDIDGKKVIFTPIWKWLLDH